MKIVDTAVDAPPRLPGFPGCGSEQERRKLESRLESGRIVASLGNIADMMRLSTALAAKRFGV